MPYVASVMVLFTVGPALPAYTRLTLLTARRRISASSGVISPASSCLLISSCAKGYVILPSMGCLSPLARYFSISASVLPKRFARWSRLACALKSRSWRPPICSSNGVINVSTSSRLPSNILCAYSSKTSWLPASMPLLRAGSPITLRSRLSISRLVSFSDSSISSFVILARVLPAVLFISRCTVSDLGLRTLLSNLVGAGSSSASIR